jgi:hypothetical protein
MNPHDPALEPVAAAKAAMADAEGNTPPQPAPRSRPVIEPAEGDRWSKVVPLAFALVVDGVRLESLTLTRLSSRALTDIIMQDDNEESINLRARAAIAGVHPDVLMALDADDGVEVTEAIRPFLPRVLLGAETLELELLAAAASRAGAGV